MIVFKKRFKQIKISTMKKLFFLFLVFPICVFAQIENPTYGNYKFENKERTVSWVKVFNIDSTIVKDGLKSYFERNGIIKFNIDSNSELIGELVKSKIDVVKYGVSNFNAPIGLQNEIIANVLIEAKAGRYRVTLNNIRFIENGSSDLIMKAVVGSNAPTLKGNESPINGNFAFREDGIVRTRIKTILEIMDKYFVDILQFKTLKKLKEDF
jgi:hypothetical protein